MRFENHFRHFVFFPCHLVLDFGYDKEVQDWSNKDAGSQNSGGVESLARKSHPKSFILGRIMQAKIRLKQSHKFWGDEQALSKTHCCNTPKYYASYFERWRLEALSGWMEQTSGPTLTVCEWDHTAFIAYVSARICTCTYLYTPSPTAAAVAGEQESPGRGSWFLVHLALPRSAFIMQAPLQAPWEPWERGLAGS